MRKLATVVLMVLVLLALGLTGIAIVLATPARPGLPDGIDKALGAYKVYESRAGNAWQNVIAVRQASRPGAFTKGMSDVSVGSSMYSTDYVTTTWDTGGTSLTYPP